MNVGELIEYLKKNFEKDNHVYICDRRDTRLYITLYENDLKKEDDDLIITIC